MATVLLLTGLSKLVLSCSEPIQVNSPVQFSSEQNRNQFVAQISQTQFDGIGGKVDYIAMFCSDLPTITSNLPFYYDYRIVDVEFEQSSIQWTRESPDSTILRITFTWTNNYSETYNFNLF